MECFEFYIISSKNVEKQFNNYMFFVHKIKYLEYIEFYKGFRVKFFRKQVIFIRFNEIIKYITYFKFFQSMSI